MKRRRKETELASRLQLTWQITAAMAAGGFVLFRWILPSTLNGIMAMALTPLYTTFSWAVLIGFGLISLVAFLRSRKLTLNVADQTQNRREPKPLTEPDVSLGPAAHMDGKASPGTAVDRCGLDAGAVALARPVAWSKDVLFRMEWKRFELLAAAYYRALDFRTKTIRCGADGGIDIKLYRGAAPEAICLVQCKAWNSRPVGVKPVRELLGVMTHEKVKAGIFLATSTFTEEAIRFAQGNRLVLVNGDEFLAKILALPAESATYLLTIATEGAWTTPSCPSCGVKMTKRDGATGPFWGCPSFPRCRQTFMVAKDPSG